MRKLTDLLATSATGYGAVIDGVLNIRTLSETGNMAALNALHIIGFDAYPDCDDPDCDCVVGMLHKLRPEVQIVPVSVEVGHA